MPAQHAAAPDPDSDMESLGALFQFDERYMALLRSGDREAENKLAEALFGHFDRLVRAVRRYTSDLLCREDAEDAVMDFFANKFRRVVQLYRFQPAASFTAKFYKAIKNYSLDWLDKRMRRDGSALSIYQPIGDGKRTVEDKLPPWRDAIEGGLRPEEVSAFEKEVRDYLVSWSGDPVRQWVLEACLFGGWKPKEVVIGVAEKFSGKVYELGSVYALVSRFRNDPGLRKIRERYF